MSKEIYWVRTTEEVFFAIFMQHRKEMGVFGTCTCPDGDMLLGHTNPYIMTEWGFERSDFPLIREIRTKKSLEQENWDFEYSLSILKEE